MRCRQRQLARVALGPHAAAGSARPSPWLVGPRRVARPITADSNGRSGRAALSASSLHPGAEPVLAAAPVNTKRAGSCRHARPARCPPGFAHRGGGGSHRRRSRRRYRVWADSSAICATTGPIRARIGSASLPGGSEPRASSARTHSSSSAPASSPSSRRCPTPHVWRPSSSTGSASRTSSSDSLTLIPNRWRRKARAGCSTKRTRLSSSIRSVDAGGSGCGEKRRPRVARTAHRLCPAERDLVEAPGPALARGHR